MCVCVCVYASCHGCRRELFKRFPVEGQFGKVRIPTETATTYTAKYTEALTGLFSTADIALLIELANALAVSE